MFKADKLNTSAVTDMRDMFYKCTNLNDITALANWNVSNVTIMYYMFYDCSNLTNVTALANWNVSNVTDMYGMFANCPNLTVLDISGWDTSQVSNVIYFLDSCSKLIS